MAVYRKDVRKWPGGVIPVQAVGTWEKKAGSAIDAAMNDWSLRTGRIIKFVSIGVSNPGYALRIKLSDRSQCAKGFNPDNKGTDCTIGTGKDGKVKTPDQIYKTAIHELGHCIGLSHEQLHPETPETTLLEIAKAIGGEGKGTTDQLWYLEYSKKEAKSVLQAPMGFDSESIMLYHGGNIQISDGDAETVRIMYANEGLSSKAELSDNNNNVNRNG